MRDSLMLNITARCDVFGLVVDILKVVVDDAAMTFDKDGLTVSAVDPGHVAMVHLRLDASAFDTYGVEEEIEIGVQLDKVKQTLQMASSNDSLNLRYDEKVGIIHLEVGNIHRTISPLNLSEINVPRVMEVPVQASVKISGADIHRGMKAAYVVSDVVVISIEPEGMAIKVENATDGVNVTYSDAELQSIECSEEQQSSYSMPYLVNLTKRLESLPTMDFGLTSGSPLRADFEFADAAGKGLYLLAPRRNEGTY